VWPPGSRGLGSTPGSGSLSAHAGQLSAYSEINIWLLNSCCCCYVNQTSAVYNQYTLVPIQSMSYLGGLQQEGDLA